MVLITRDKIYDFSNKIVWSFGPGTFAIFDMLSGKAIYGEQNLQVEDLRDLRSKAEYIYEKEPKIRRER